MLCSTCPQSGLRSPHNSAVIFQPDRQFHSLFPIKRASGFQTLWPRPSVWNTFYAWTTSSVKQYSHVATWNAFCCFPEEENAGPDPLNWEEHCLRRPFISISWNSTHPASLVPSPETVLPAEPLVAFSELRIFFSVSCMTFTANGFTLIIDGITSLLTRWWVPPGLCPCGRLSTWAGRAGVQPSVGLLRNCMVSGMLRYLCADLWKLQLVCGLPGGGSYLPRLDVLICCAALDSLCV